MATKHIPGQSATVQVRGLADLQRAFANAGKDTKKEVRAALKDVAEPIRSQAAVLALSTIRNMDKSPKWAGMRTGVTRKVVYVVPKQKGTHGRGPRRRPNFANLLADRAMYPALERNRANVYRRMERMVDTVGQKWERD